MAQFDTRIPTEQIVVTLRLPRGFGIRMWCTVQLLKLAGWVAPVTIEVDMGETEAPPIRYSVDQPDFDPEIGRKLVIRVDGIEQRQAIEYDCEAGTVLRNKLDGEGMIQVNPDKPDEVWTETVTGNVTVEWRD